MIDTRYEVHEQGLRKLCTGLETESSELTLYYSERWQDARAGRQ